MKTLTTIFILACAHQVVSAAVMVYQVPRPPTDAIWFTNTTEFDFDGNSLSKTIIQEGDTQCIGNEVSVRCSTGFRVDFGVDIQLFASTGISQVLPGTTVGESILGTDGSWAHKNSLYFGYHYGTAGSGYNTNLISERFAVPIRLLVGSGYRYGFLDIDMLEQTFNSDGSTSEIIRPHVVGIALEADLDIPVSVFSIPEPSSIMLIASGFCAFAATRRRRGEQDAPCNPYQPPCFDDLP